MKRLGFFVLLTTCCFIFSQEAKAQSVYGQAWVEYYEPTNSIRAVGYSQPDYSVQVYYSAEIRLTVYQDENYLGDGAANNYHDWCWHTAYCGNAEIELYFPYNPGSEYAVEAEHTARDVQYPQYAEYTDPYGYYTLYGYDTLYHPVYYNFIGTGTPSGLDIKDMVLGVTDAFFTQGAPAAAPHHLKVDDDLIREAQPRPNVTGPCGQIERLIKYQVVSEDGRNVGRTSIGETFPGRIISSCSGQDVRPTGCSTFSGGSFSGNYTDRSGKFTDTLRVGCPAPQDNCGFIIDPNQWVACSGQTFNTRTTLARLVYEVAKRQIKVNGRSTRWKRRTEFFPNGSSYEPPD